MARGLSTARQATRQGSTLPALPASLKVLFIGLDSVLARNRTGVGDSLSGKSGNNITLNDAGGAFTADDFPQYISTSGWLNGGNNGGPFPVIANPSGTSITYVNAAAVNEVNATATWELHGRITSITDRVAGLVATPASTALALSAFPSAGKILAAEIQNAAVVTQNTALDSGGVIAALSGDVDLSFYMYGFRQAQVTGVPCQISNSALSHFSRASFNSTNTMRLIRNDGTLDSTTIVTSANIANTAMHSWCWAFDNTVAGQLQAFRDSVSLGAPVAPGSKRSPLLMDRFRLGSISANEGHTWRAMGIFNTYASTTDQAMVDAYVAAVYA